MNRHAIMAQMQADVRGAVLAGVRQGEQLVALAGRDTEETRRDLELWTAQGRELSVEHEGLQYFALFALNPANGYPKLPAKTSTPRFTVVRDAEAIVMTHARRGTPLGLAP